MDLAWSVADALDRLAPSTDPALTGAARARLHALAAHLPAALSRVIYLESWIGQPWPRLDLIVKIEPRDRDALVELVDSAALRDQPGWADVARFARAWAAPGLLADGIRAAWLELDLDPQVEPAAALKAPRVFVDFTRDAQCWPAIDARLALATEVLAALSGARDPARVASLRACLAHLPPGATLAYLGVFAAAVRACVVGLDGRLAAYLAAVGWPGDARELARDVLDPLARGQAEPVRVIHLDLAPGVGPRLGLEYTFPRPGVVSGLRSPDALLRQLVARGWCTARNRDALRAWPRRSIEVLPHDIWHSRIERHVAHIKLAYTPGAPVVAKAYLRTGYELIAGGTLVAGRARRFGDGARAPFDGAMSPSPAPIAAQPPVPARARPGTAVAHLARQLRRATGMTMSTAHQEALEQILNRATVDVAFRKALLHDPRKAILEGLGVRIPAGFRVKFIERQKDVDALIVLPDLERCDGELDDEDLDAVAGGAEADPTNNW